MKSILISIYINIFRISFAQDNHLHEEPYVRFYAMYSLLQNNAVYCNLTFYHKKSQRNTINKQGKIGQRNNVVQ